MNKCKVDNLKNRLEKLEQVLADAAGGFLWARVPVNAQNVDYLTSIEVGVNIILSDLEEATADRLELMEQLEKLRGEKK